MSADVVIVGGGVIGLSLAWELAGQGRQVSVLDKQQTGREASWAGAGILPPGYLPGAVQPFDQLRALSFPMWKEWSDRLLEETGIDNGYHQCGGLTVTVGEESCQPYQREWNTEGVELEALDGAGLREYEPELSAGITSGFRLPGLGQVRNPRHLQALVAACRKRGVEIRENAPVTDIRKQGDHLLSVKTQSETFSAPQFCFTAGSWTQHLLQSVGYQLPIVPIRGQIVLYRTTAPLITHVIEVGKRYLVPRQDGRLLAGATEEDVGFVKENTEQGIDGLKQLAVQLVPALGNATIEKTWSGLRPMSQTGRPFLGELPGLSNAYVAAGHFRSGLQTSLATALVMRQLMCGEVTSLDLSPFEIDSSHVESNS